MKVSLKKLAVMAAAVTILFAFSACNDPNGNGTTEDTSTTTENDSTDTSTTTTTTEDDSTTPGDDTTAEETTGGESGTSTSGEDTSTVTTVAVFEYINTTMYNMIFYSDKTWEMLLTSGGQNVVYGCGTYTGNPSQDGNFSMIVTKEVTDSSMELQDCTPLETLNLTITDDSFKIEKNGVVLYLIRKAKELVNYVTLINDGKSYNLLKYIFYDNYTVRLIEDGKPVLYGIYTGNPCADGNITCTSKYQYSPDDGWLISKDTTPIAISIENGSFRGSSPISAAREIEVFKTKNATETADMGISFYADGTFLWVYIMTATGTETPYWYGTYTGNPCSTEANAQISITFTHGYTFSLDDKEEGPNSNTWIESKAENEDQINTITLTINNNQFPFTIGSNMNGESLVVNFIRQ